MPARVFVGIELPEPARHLLTAATSALLRESPAWSAEKVVAPGLLHVTLAFVGRVDDAACAGLIERLTVAASGVRAFDLRLAGLRAVPSARRASMVWATLDGGTEAATALAAALAGAAGLPPEDRAFTPHVTLVRARRSRRVHAPALEAAGAALSAPGKEADRMVSVLSVTVFSSTLGSAGPAYEPIARIPLAKGAGTPRAD